MNHDLGKNVKTSQIIHTLNRMEIIPVTQSCVSLEQLLLFQSKLVLYSLVRQWHLNSLGFNFLTKVKAENDDNNVKSKHLTHKLKHITKGLKITEQLKSKLAELKAHNFEEIIEETGITWS